MYIIRFAITNLNCVNYSCTIIKVYKQHHIHSTSMAEILNGGCLLISSWISCILYIFTLLKKKNHAQFGKSAWTLNQSSELLRSRLPLVSLSLGISVMQLSILLGPSVSRFRARVSNAVLSVARSCWNWKQRCVQTLHVTNLCYH